MEQELTLEELFQFMEEHEGEFFIRVELSGEEKLEDE